MPGLYARWMDRWERDLATRDTNRVVRPFDFGVGNQSAWTVLFSG